MPFLGAFHLARAAARRFGRLPDLTTNGSLHLVSCSEEHPACHRRRLVKGQRLRQTRAPGLGVAPRLACFRRPKKNDDHLRLQSVRSTSTTVISRALVRLAEVALGRNFPGDPSPRGGCFEPCKGPGASRGSSRDRCRPSDRPPWLRATGDGFERPLARPDQPSFPRSGARPGFRRPEHPSATISRGRGWLPRRW